MGRGKMILEVRGLCAETESGISLLRNLDFTVDEGEIVGIAGQSGSGKSLTSLAIMGLLPKTIRVRGSIVLAGREISGLGEGELNKIRGAYAAIVFQEPGAALDPLMSMGRQIALALKKHSALRGAKLREGVYTLMEEVMLKDISRLARSFPHEVSGGQRQRVAIAIALACSPKLLIADEPTSSVDAQVQKQLLSLIADAAVRRNMGALFITHDIAAARKIAGRILVMKDGRIVEEASAEKLIESPQHEYTRLLIESVKRLDMALKARRA
jgi:peptide/nickel transport system ATP-binding protein